MNFWCKVCKIHGDKKLITDMFGHYVKQPSPWRYIIRALCLPIKYFINTWHHLCAASCDQLAPSMYEASWSEKVHLRKAVACINVSHCVKSKPKYGLYLVSWCVLYLVSWCVLYLVSWCVLYLVSWCVLYLVSWCVLYLVSWCVLYLVSWCVLYFIKQFSCVIAL